MHPETSAQTTPRAGVRMRQATSYSILLRSSWAAGKTGFKMRNVGMSNEHCQILISDFILPIGHPNIAHLGDRGMLSSGSTPPVLHSEFHARSTTSGRAVPR